MREEDVKAISEVKGLPLFDATDPEAKSLTSGSSAFEVAEAEDMIRLLDLIHRAEYRAIAIVRFRVAAQKTVRVYFRLLDQDE